jgi:hypothetical protein
MCGLYALEVSLRAVREFQGYRTFPSVKELKSVMHSREYKRKMRAHDRKGMFRNNLNVDQLALILQLKGNELGEDYQLGISYPKTVKKKCAHCIYLYPHPKEATSVIVWVFNDNLGAVNGMIGHWEGIGPPR